MRTLLLLFGVFVFNNASAQRVCATYNPQSQRPEDNHHISTSNVAARDTIANEIITIPVVVHVVYNTNIQNISDAQIFSQIASLNQDFSLMNSNSSGIPAAFLSKAADVKIQFMLAKFDPMGRPTNGIVRKSTNKVSFKTDDAVKFSGAGGSDIWDSKQYLNIWVCNQEGNSLGYSSVPGSSPDRDGVVINYNVFGTTGVLRAPFNKGRTATHEIGHWLGLRHIWGDSNCGSDDVDDTPRQKSSNFGTPSFPHLSDCSVNGYGDMFMNYMDLTDDAVMNMFTNGQKIKMRSLFAINGFRNEMLSSKGIGEVEVANAPLPGNPVEEPVANISVKIYPNPASNFLNIEFTESADFNIIPATLYNSQGVPMKKLIIENKKTSVGISDLKPGVYFLRVGVSKGSEVLKVVKI